MSGRSSWLPGAASFGEKPAWRGGVGGKIWSALPSETAADFWKRRLASGGTPRD